MAQTENTDRHPHRLSDLWIRFLKPRDRRAAIDAEKQWERDVPKEDLSPAPHESEIMDSEGHRVRINHY